MATKRPYTDFQVFDGIGMATNCPPDSQKDWAKEGIPFPRIILAGDTAMHQGVPLCCPEFPTLGHLFPGKGYEKGIVKPIYLLATEDRGKALYHSTRLCVHGPTEQEYKNRIRIKPAVQDLLTQIQQDMMLKDVNGQVIPFHQIVKTRFFDKGELMIEEFGMKVVHVGKDHYVVHAGGGSREIVLTSEGDFKPSWPIPRFSEIEVPHGFRVYVIGSDSGFGPKGTTGFLLELDGRRLLWDCPASCSQVLEVNGIDPGDIDGIVISHVHGDHLGDAAKFALNRRKRIEIICSREIWWMFQWKLMAEMNISLDRLNHLFTWREVKPAYSEFSGKPEDINGVTFAFHYNVHPIPSLGAKVFKNGQQVLAITGDTCGKKELECKVKKGVVQVPHAEYLLNLHKPGSITLADSGRFGIHPDPSDLSHLDQSEVILYHHPDPLPAEIAAHYNLARPGDIICQTDSDANVKVFDSVLLSEVLQSMGIETWTKWANIIGQQSESIRFGEDRLIIEKGSNDKKFVYVIAHGKVNVLIDDQVVATLGQGDYFGETALLTGNSRDASIRSISTVRLIAIPGNLFIQMMQEDERLKQATGRPSAMENLLKTYKYRLIISQVLNGATTPSKTNEISARVVERVFRPCQNIILKGSDTEEVYILIEGQVEVLLNKEDQKNPIIDPIGIFGEATALKKYNGKPDSDEPVLRSATIKTLEATRVLILEGKYFAELVRSIPRVKFEMDQLLAVRGLAPATN